MLITYNTLSSSPQGYLSSLNFLFEVTKEKVDKELRIFADDVGLRMLSGPDALTPRKPVTKNTFPPDPSLEMPVEFQETSEDDDQEEKGGEKEEEEQEEVVQEEPLSWLEGARKLQTVAVLCEEMTVEEFAAVVEDFVRDLNASRSLLEPGTLSQLHSRLLFILTRCTRILQLQREFGLKEESPFHALAKRNSVTSPKQIRIPPPSPPRDFQYRTRGSLGVLCPEPAPWRSRDPLVDPRELNGSFNWGTEGQFKAEGSEEQKEEERNKEEEETREQEEETIGEIEIQIAEKRPFELAMMKESGEIEIMEEDKEKEAEGKEEIIELLEQFLDDDSFDVRAEARNEMEKTEEKQEAVGTENKEIKKESTKETKKSSSGVGLGAKAGQAALLASKFAVWKRTPSFRAMRRGSRLGKYHRVDSVASLADLTEKKHPKKDTEKTGGKVVGKLRLSRIMSQILQRRSKESKKAVKEKAEEEQESKETVLEEEKSESMQRKEIEEDELAAAKAVDTWDKDEEEASEEEYEDLPDFEEEMRQLTELGQPIVREMERDVGTETFWPDPDDTELTFHEDDEQEEDYMVLCRICEEDVRRCDLEDHSKFCELADECNAEGLSLDERLTNVSEMLKKMVEEGAVDLGFLVYRAGSDFEGAESPAVHQAQQQNLAQSQVQPQGQMQKQSVPAKVASASAPKTQPAIEGQPNAAKMLLSAHNSGGSSPATMVSNMGSSLMSSYLSDTPSGEANSPLSGGEELMHSEMMQMEETDMIDRQQGLFELEAVHWGFKGF